METFTAKVTQHAYQFPRARDPELQVDSTNNCARCFYFKCIFVSYPQPGGEGNLLLWSVQIKGSDLTLDLAVERGFPELLVGPDGMVLNARVGKLVYARGQFLQHKTVDLVYYFTLLQDITPILGLYEYLTQTLICLKINLKVTGVIQDIPTRAMNQNLFPTLMTVHSYHNICIDNQHSSKKHHAGGTAAALKNSRALMQSYTQGCRS